MTILTGDIKFLASKVMTDDPEGGGGPVGTVIPDGASNAIFQDVTEFDRAGGAVSIRELFLAVQTPSVDVFMDANIIVSSPPDDANVSVTLAKCNMFHRRTDIANAIENYLIQGPEWPGYLLENHVIGQRSIQLYQRTGTPPPPIGRTLVLIYNEGLAGERKQYVRVTRVETEARTFTYTTAAGFADYTADVVTCDLSDALRLAFPGSAPSRGYAREVNKTVLRDTTVADAATYYGCVPLTAAAALGDVKVFASSVYSQLVPSARTETAALDQRPAAVRQLTLATSPRAVTVGAAPHSRRTKVGQENRGFAWVQILKPFPAPGTVVVSFMALGVWYTLMDDGLGGFTGSGVGTVNYANGSISITLPALPDVGSVIVYSWGEKSAYTDQSGRAGYRAPEFAWSTPQAPLKPGSVVVTWPSGGVLKTATDNATGGFTGGSATGEINYAAGKIFFRPTAMLDVGGEFQTAYTYSTTRIENIAGVAIDVGGFATISLQEAPAPRSVNIEWVTVRNVSESAGASDFVSNSSITSGATYETRTREVLVPYVMPRPEAPAPPLPPPPEVLVRGVINTSKLDATGPGETITMRLLLNTVDPDGTYYWQADRYSGGAAADTFEEVTGEIVASSGFGFFTLRVKKPLAASGAYTVTVRDGASTWSASSAQVHVDRTADATLPENLPKHHILNGLGTYYEPYQLTPGDSVPITFQGPLRNGGYTWQILAPNAADSFVSTTGSFEVLNGVGGFWIVSKLTAPNEGFVVEILNPSTGVPLIRSVQCTVTAAPTPPSGWQPPPPAAIKVRDPITTGNSLTASGASQPIAGMYAGGVDSAGATVFVAVLPTGSNKWGQAYDPPASVSEAWSPAEIAAKSKTMVSANAVTTTYRIWGG